MPLTPRKIGQASVNPIGFGAMGISIAYGAVGTDEERLKVCIGTCLALWTMLISIVHLIRSLMLSMKAEATIGILLMPTVIPKCLLENGAYLYSIISFNIIHITSLRLKNNPGKRDSVFLATKFGFTPNGVCGTPEHVKEACAKSLERLGVDQIDLYYQHR